MKFADNLIEVMRSDLISDMINKFQARILFVLFCV